MKNAFNAHAYIADNYTEAEVEEFCEAHGDNGYDLLMSAESEEDVDELLEGIEEDEAELDKLLERAAAVAEEHTNVARY